MNENKNLLMAVVLSLGVFIGFNYLSSIMNPEKTSEASVIAPASQQTTLGVAASSPAPSQGVEEQVELPRSQALLKSERIKVETPSINGSINLVGARFDDVSLVKYHETTDPKSPEITLLSPRHSHHAYFVDFGWLSGAGIPVPNDTTLWKSDHHVLSVGKPVTLTWDNGQGCLFVRVISVDDLYVFTIEDRVINKTAQPIKLNSYGQITRQETPTTGGFFILHEGPIGVLNGKLKELDYSDLLKEATQQTTTGGWLGITDKYWLVSLIPDQKISYVARFKGQVINGHDQYQTELVSPEYDVAPGGQVQAQYHLFSGAKDLRILDDYEEKFGFSKFDLAVDFGWFYFLTKPLFYFLEYLNKFFGNLGVAILVMTVFFKIALFPLANKSYRSMSRMKQLQPKMEALKKRYENDKMRLNQEMMELYKKEKVNPLSGCLPMVIQAPLFFCLYKVLFVTIEMRQAPFFGWIHDLSAPDPTSLCNLFGLLPFTPPSFLMIGAWPILMGLTMLLQQRLNPQPADPAQAKMFMIMPFIMTFLFASFPAGLVIYWAWNNILSIAQQWWIMRLEEKRTA